MLSTNPKSKDVSTTPESSWLERIATFFQVWRLAWKAGPIEVAESFVLQVMTAVVPSVQVIVTTRLVTMLAEVVRHPQAFRSVLVWFVVQGGLLLATAVGRTARQWTSARLHNSITGWVDAQVLRKTARLSLAFFDQDSSLNTLHRATASQGPRVAQAITGSAQVAQAVLTVAGYLVVLGRFNSRLPWPLFAVVIPVLWVNLRIGAQRYGLLVSQTPSSRELQYTYHLNLTREPAKELRVFGLVEYIYGRWLALFQRTRREQLRLLMKTGRAQIVTEIIGTVAITGLLGELAWMAVHGELTLGQVVGAIQAINGTYSSTQSMAMSLAQLHEGSLMIRDLFRFLQNPDENVEQTALLPFPNCLREGITVSHITFHYQGQATHVLQDLTFTVLPGQTIAIIGPNGSGKSTLVKCLLGLYRPTQGTVKYDNLPTTEIDPVEMRRHVTAIFQDFVRYEWTVRENVAVGDIERRDDTEWIRNRLEVAGAGEWIDSLANGLDTQVGPRFAGGHELSGGQWQKLAVARALARDADVVVLDEPTAALDPVAESDLFARLIEKKRPNAIVILVSHRLGFCPLADWILVMDRGRIVQEGTHKTLIGCAGPYQDAYQAQQAAYS